jgi:hypothetical protein
MRPLLWIFGILGTLLLGLAIASFFIDEPLRRIMEQKINRDLKGYSVRLPGLHLQLIGLSLTLKGLTVQQQAHPDPPVAYFPVIKTSIHWREVLSGHLLAEFSLDRPRLNINLLQLRNEAQSKVKLKEKGWQQAVEDIYPLKINSLKIKDASITYIDKDPKRPLTLSHLNLQAGNIRNVHLPDKVYPSTFHVDTTIFATGHGTIDGKANFLAEPIPTVKARIKLEDIPIDSFKPVLANVNLAMSGGVLRATGDVEYAPKFQVAHLEDLTIQGMKVDYLHSVQTAHAEKKRAIVVGKTAKKLSKKPELLLSIDQINLKGCNLGMVNQSAGKRFRLFLSDADFQLSNLTNKDSRGPAKLKLRGNFMGSGATDVTGEFHPEKKGTDLDLFVKVDNTRLASMNDLLRDYGNFDVSAGTFSLVTELHVKNDTLSGYIKPFFKDVTVYDRRKDKNSSLSHQVYEMLVGGAAKLLENRQRDQVATRVVISGSLKDPKTSTWQIITGLFKNAFFKAILPNFEKGAAKAGKQ